MDPVSFLAVLSVPVYLTGILFYLMAATFEDAGDFDRASRRALLWPLVAVRRLPLLVPWLAALGREAVLILRGR